LQHQVAPQVDLQAGTAVRDELFNWLSEARESLLPGVEFNAAT